MVRVGFVTGLAVEAGVLRRHAAPHDPDIALRVACAGADALRARRPDTVAVSPIVAGKALKGPADRLLRELGHEASVVGVARLYRDLYQDP